MIRKEKSNKILELFNLTIDPLFQLFNDNSKPSDSLTELIDEFDPEKDAEKEFSINSLPSITDEESFKKTILNLLQQQLFHPKEPANPSESSEETSATPVESEKSASAAETSSLSTTSSSAVPTVTITQPPSSENAPSSSTTSHKRKPDSALEHRHHKVQRTSSYHTSYPPTRLITNRIPKPESSVTSLKSQQQVYEEDLASFLEKSINDLEIISLPESYPTSAHNVSSLAELYYLTQTLPLIKLIPGCHKTLMTDNFELALFEGKIAVLYSRIEELKRQSKWSLRQPSRYFDPFIYDTENRKSNSLTVKKQNKTYHWDSIINEGKWMAADFKESLKFKKACCFAIAEAVKEYWILGKEVCIKPKPIVHIEDKEPVKEEAEAMEVDKPETEEAAVPEATAPEEVTEPVEKPEEVAEEAGVAEPEPETIEEDLVSNETTVKIEEVAGTEIPEASEPASIDVNLLVAQPNPEEEVIPSAAEISQVDIDRLKRNSAIHNSKGPFKLHADIQDFRKIDQSIIKNLPKFTAFDDDEITQMSAPPIKPGESPMVPVSRLLYTFEDDDDWYKIILKDSQASTNANKSQGPPEYQKGLFGVQSHRRFNYLKPPKPPLVKNIEYRSPTIWLPQDDKYLIHYVAEFCFNWELISEHLLSTASTLRKYESNIERRTPWQCFERYIQLNEKFQFSDMKGVYAYHAQQWLEQAHRAQLTTKRRISPLGVGNESIQRGHRRLRWASMFDAMRKSMRKRETQIAKMSQRKGTTPSSSSSESSTTNSSVVNTNGNNSNNGPTGNNGTAGTNGNNANNANNAPNTNNNNVVTPNTTKRDRVPTPAELSRLKFERDKSIQEAYLNQQATRSRMMAAVAQQQRQLLLQNPKQPLQQPSLQQQRQPGPPGQASQLQQRSSGQPQLQGPIRNVSPSSQQPPIGGRTSSSQSVLLQGNLAQQQSLTPQQRAALSANSAQNSSGRVGQPASQIGQTSSQQLSQPQVRRPAQVPVASGGSIPQQLSQLSSSQLTPQQQQQQQQLRQQQAFAQIMAKRPTTPNGTPYTPEQIQQLIQIQKQRRLMQQQQAAKAQGQSQVPGQTTVNSNLLAQNQKRQAMTASPVNSQQFQQKQQLPGLSAQQQRPQSSEGSGNSTQVGQSGQLGTQIGQARVGQPAKARIQFAPAQVSAIINSIQTKNPNLTKEQVTRLAATYLANIQQQQQNRLNQQNRTGQPAPGGGNVPQGSSNAGSFQQRVGQKPLGIAQQRQLTPQERNQLQMLKAAKAAQQQSLQQNHLQQSPLSPIDGLQRTTSSPIGNGSPLDALKMTKLQYEERKKLLLQKQQQQQQRINNNMSPLSGASSPSLSNSSLSPGKSLDNDGSPN